MINRTFSSLFLLLLLVGTVSAQSCDDSGFIGTFKRNQPIVFTQTCPTCNFINITLKSPSSSILLSNQEMTFANGRFSFNIGGGNMSVVGLYFIEGFSNLDEPFLACFQVNETGIEFDNLWMNFLIIFLLSTGSFTLIYQFNESRNTIDRQEGNFIYYYLGAFMLFSLGVITLIFGFGGYITLLTQALGFILWGSGLFFLARPWSVGRQWHW